MPRLRHATAVLLAAGVVTLPVVLSAPAQGRPAPLAMSKVIVALDGDVTDAFLATLDTLGVVRGIELPSIDAVAVTAPAAVVAKIAKLPGVRAVQPQRKLRLDLFHSKGQIKAVGVNEAKRYTRGSNTFERPGVTGAGVTVGIIDSGIFAPHPGFGGRVGTGLNFEFSELPDSGGIPTEVWDAYAEATGATALQDELGHGTHVAGTVGGNGGGTQSDRDLAGVASEVELVALKIASAFNGLLDDIGFEENAMAAIDYLIRHPALNVKLTNNSWGLLETEPSSVPGGEPTDFDAANAMVKKATEAGITMVFSAGNDGPDAGSINLDPGGLPEAITVAAACKGEENGGDCAEGDITGFSSRGLEDGTGPQVDVSAPGDQILAPVSPSILAPLTECLDPAEPLYYCISGTSMASPHVAGVVALMQEVNPKLTPAQAESCLKSTAADMLTKGFDIHSGMGMVDTPPALECAHQLSGARPIGGGPVDPGPDPDPDPDPDPTPGPGAAPRPDTHPATGSGQLLGLLGLVTLAAAFLLRRRGAATV